MLIVDSQVHVWHRDDPESKPRHGDRPFGRTDVLAEMRAANVDRALLVPPYWEGWDNSAAVDAARLHPDKFRVMGRFDVSVPNPQAVATWLAQPEMLGIRLTLHTPQMRPYVSGEAADWFWDAAQKAGLPVMVHAPGELAGLERIARKFPALQLAIDHLAIGRGVRDAAAFEHLDDLLRLASCANISVKMSAVPLFSSEPYPHRGIHPYLRAVCEAYGPRRLFWGTDLTRLPCSYRVAVNLFLEEFTWLDDSDLEWIMGRALCEWSGWTS